jgi:NADH:ubiquinone oxidoreductase subunit 2 (subunit N)
MKKIALAALAFLFPLVSSAQVIDSATSGAAYVVNLINNVLVPLLFAVSFIVFIYGIFTYFIRGASDPKKREEGISIVVYGIIGFFLMVSVWGLVHILIGTVRTDNLQPTFPQAQQVH